MSLLDIAMRSYTELLFVVFLDEAPSTLDSIMRLKSQLSDLIEPDFGLLDHLLSLDVLTRKQRSKVRAGEKATYERTEAVLDLLTSEVQCGKFLVALKQTGQQHVVNFITQNGGQNNNLTLCTNVNNDVLQTLTWYCSQ